jgi:hypothetical protein
MKSFRIGTTLLFVLALASLCAAQSKTDSASSASKSKGTMSGNMAMGMSAKESMIVASEQKVIDAIKSRNVEGFKAMVDQSGWLVTSQGTKQVSEITPQIFNPADTFTDYRMENPKVMMLNKKMALLTYKSISAGMSGGKSMSETTYDSTLWVKRNGKWVAIFHQISPMMNPATSAAMQ